MEFICNTHASIPPPPEPLGVAAVVLEIGFSHSFMTGRREVPAEVFPLAEILVKNLLVANDKKPTQTSYIYIYKKKRRVGREFIRKIPGVA